MPEYTKEQINEAKKLLEVSAKMKSGWWVGNDPIPETILLSALSTFEQERDALLEMVDKSSGAIDVSRIWCDRYAQLARAEKAESERDALAARCAELEARMQGAADRISQTLHEIPAQQEGGGFFTEHFDQDGNYQGTENIPEMYVVQRLHQAMIELRAAILGEKKE